MNAATGVLDAPEGAHSDHADAPRLGGDLGARLRSGLCAPARRRGRAARRLPRVLRVERPARVPRHRHRREGRDPRGHAEPPHLGPRRRLLGGEGRSVGLAAPALRHASCRRPLRRGHDPAHDPHRAPLWALGGDRLALVLPMLGGLAVAAAALALARRLGAKSPITAFWVIGLASPVFLYSMDLWEHTLGLACMAWAVILLYDTWTRVHERVWRARTRRGRAVRPRCDDAHRVTALRRSRDRGDPARDRRRRSGCAASVRRRDRHARRAGARSSSPTTGSSARCSAGRCARRAQPEASAPPDRSSATRAGEALRTTIGLNYASLGVEALAGGCIAVALIAAAVMISTGRGQQAAPGRAARCGRGAAARPHARRPLVRVGLRARAADRRVRRSARVARRAPARARGHRAARAAGRVDAPVHGGCGTAVGRPLRVAHRLPARGRRRGRHRDAAVLVARLRDRAVRRASRSPACATSRSAATRAGGPRTRSWRCTTTS